MALIVALIVRVSLLDCVELAVVVKVAVKDGVCVRVCDGGRISRCRPCNLADYTSSSAHLRARDEREWGVEHPRCSAGIAAFRKGHIPN